MTELGIGDHWSWADFDINTRKGYWRSWHYVGVDRSLRGPVVVDAPDGDYIKWAVEEGLKVGPKAAYMWCDWDYLDEKGHTVRKLTEEEMCG